MDDKADSQYSRAPTLEDLISLCRSLNKQGVEYILIGGFAVILHGFVRGTKDIDLLIDDSKDNIQKVKKALSILPDNAVAQIEDDEVARYTVVRIADEIVVDLMAKACAIDYQEASNEIKYVTLEDIQIPIAGKELLIRMKNTIRPSDKADVNFLKVRIEEEKKIP